MSEQEIKVTDSDQTSVAARESQSDTPAAAEQPTPKAGKESPPAAEASDAADAGDDGEDTQNETGESADPGSDGQAKPKNRGVGKRIDELTKARYDAERERDHWRELAMRQQQPPPGQPQPAPAAAQAETGEPTLESCDFDQAKFTREWYAWRRAEDQKAESAQKRQAAFQERVTAFRAEHPDYDAVTGNPALPITQAMADVILETEDPPAVAYFLGQNPSEAAAIAQMTPVQIARAIGRLEAKLSAPPAASEAAPRQPVPKTVTKAPPPVTTLTGAPAVRKSYEDMSQEEYEQARRAEREAKGLRP
jgi:hypothetical protein